MLLILVLSIFGGILSSPSLITPISDSTLNRHETYSLTIEHTWFNTDEGFLYLTVPTKPPWLGVSHHVVDKIKDGPFYEYQMSGLEIDKTGNYAYIYHNDQDEVYIFDMNDKYNPFYLDSFPACRTNGNGFMGRKGDFLYRFNGNVGSTCGHSDSLLPENSWIVWNITDPTNPFKVMDLPLGIYTLFDTRVVGNYIYSVAGSDYKLKIVAINPSDPSIIGPVYTKPLPNFYSMYGVDAFGDYIYVYVSVFQGDNYLYVFDGSTISNPVQVGVLQVGDGRCGQGKVTVVDENTVIVCCPDFDHKNFDGTGGMKIIDVTNKASPTIVNSVYCKDSCQRARRYGKYVVAACLKETSPSSDYFGIYDFEDRMNVVQMSMTTETQNFHLHDFRMKSDFIYGVDYNRLEIYEYGDITISGDPSNGFVCGDIEITVRADDSFGHINETFVLIDDNICSSHGSCSDEVCTCYENYYGIRCEVFECYGVFNNETGKEGCRIAMDPGANCVDHQTCSCSLEYFGEQCEVTTCSSVYSNDSVINVCSGHGTCYEFDECNCTMGYHGVNCELWNCGLFLQHSAEVCSERHGNCTYPGVCECEESYYGEECGVFLCNGILSNETSDYRVCYGHGWCKDETICQCFESYFGEYCNITMCHGFLNNVSGVCSGHGSCKIHEVCECNDPYYENDCRTKNRSCSGIPHYYVSSCGSHGICEDDDVCNCSSSYYTGNDCQYAICEGISAEEDEVCSNHGDCLFSSHTCDCNINNWYGVICNVTTCDSVLSNMTGFICSGHGDCVGYDDCVCNSGYYTDFCDEVTICGDVYGNETGSCSGHGNCVNTGPETFSCICDFGYEASTSSDACVLKASGAENLVDNGVNGIALGLSLGGVALLVILCLCSSILIIGICATICLCCCFLLCCFCSFSSVFGGVMLGSRRKSISQLDEIDLLQKQEGDGLEHININKSLFEIKYSNIQVKRSVGKGGSNSQIFLCEWKGKKVAFKCFQTRELFGTQDSYAEFEKEVGVMSSVRHPYCLEFYGCCLHPPRIGIVMEFCEKGDVKNFLTNNPDFAAEERIRLLYQSADAFEYLHDRNVIHRDVKSENILVTNQNIPKIIDFGLSKICSRMSMKKTKKIGTSFYMAPEVVLGEEYGKPCDVFSFSIVMWEVLANDFQPFGKNPPYNIEYKIANDESYRPDVKKISVKIRSRYEKVIDVMKKAWSKDEKERPLFGEIKTLMLFESDGAYMGV